MSTQTTMRSRRSGEDLRRQAPRGLTVRDDYILQHAPTILAALVIRRSSTNPDQLVEQAIAGVARVYDIVHELDTPATTMLSQPVEQADHGPAAKPSGQTTPT